MKKFLVMLTVLAAISNAAILELSWNGAVNGAGVDMAVALGPPVPSATAMIDVSAINGAGKINWEITANGPGSFGLGALIIPPSPNGQLIDYSATYGYSYVAFKMSVDTSAGGIGAYWTSEFHCDGPGIVTISLIDSGTGATIDTITVTQVPEPMTVALLGLGGLFLRRRK